MQRVILNVVAIIVCNWLLVSWYGYTFALGEFLIGKGGQPSTLQIVRYCGPLFLMVAILLAIGWTAPRWPLVQPALAILYLFLLLAKDLERSDWPRLLSGYAAVYGIALLVAAGGFAIRRWMSSVAFR